MKTYIIVPEGLSTDSKGKYFASDFYIGVLDKLLEVCSPGDRVYLAPANNFGAHQPEDYFAYDYLIEKKCIIHPEVIDKAIMREDYLDTLDNAILLRKHLLMHDKWPLGPVTLICNKPHKWRSYLMFKFCGYNVQKVLTSRPSQKSERRMVRRLWFYDISLIQLIYEILAIFYNTLKFFINKNR